MPTPQSEPRIRPLAPADIPALMALKEAAGWNQTAEDWQLLISLEPEGCFGLEVDGRMAASATAFSYGTDLAWIGMVLTLPEYRGRGYGSKVFNETVEYCRRRGIRSIKLDATTMGQRLYERAGFVGEYEVERWAVTTAEKFARTSGRRLDVNAIAAADTAAFGASRARLLPPLLMNSDWAQDAGPGSYAMGRPGTRAHYFGPCVAESAQKAAWLLDSFAGTYPGSPVFVDVPAPNEAARALLHERGFQVRRTLLRMVLGPNDFPGEPSRIFGLAGFEYG